MADESVMRLLILLILLLTASVCFPVLRRLDRATPTIASYSLVGGNARRLGLLLRRVYLGIVTSYSLGGTRWSYESLVLKRHFLLL